VATGTAVPPRRRLRRIIWLVNLLPMFSRLFGKNLWMGEIDKH
jgi:hypothetical protein